VVKSKAATVEEYLAELPQDRRLALLAVREIILKNLDKDYEEGMQYGMIGYYVPHRIYPAGYHCDPKQPLGFAALASQKNYMSLYLMGVYGDGSDYKRWFLDAWAKSGKKLDMGKSCIRFKKLEDLPLDVIGEAVKRMPTKKYLAVYEECMETLYKQAAKARSKPAKPKSKAARPKARPAARPANVKIVKAKAKR
jgi:hypothetical protein